MTEPIKITLRPPHRIVDSANVPTGASKILALIKQQDECDKRKAKLLRRMARFEREDDGLLYMGGDDDE
jgi:hypothetical protein